MCLNALCIFVLLVDFVFNLVLGTLIYLTICIAHFFPKKVAENISHIGLEEWAVAFHVVGCPIILAFWGRVGHAIGSNNSLRLF